MRLESGPAAYDRNYYLAFLVVCVGLGAYFLYDYKIGYPNKNLEKARKTLVPLLGADNIPETLPATPTKPTFDKLEKEQPTDPTAIHQALGEPLKRQEAPGGETIEYFVSAYGMAEVAIVNGQVKPARMMWKPWGKSKDEIKLQLYCALFTFIVGLFVFFKVYKAATLRAVIDDEGMIYGGRRILFESMNRLCDYSRKGWVDLYYQHGREERKLRIDNQKIREFDEIIEALCEAKGFEDPRKVDEEPDATQTGAAGEPPEPEDRS